MILVPVQESYLKIFLKNWPSKMLASNICLQGARYLSVVSVARLMHKNFSILCYTCYKIVLMI